MTQETASAARPLGFWMCTALVVGNMIGSGIFLLPAALAPYGGISIFGWLFTSIGAVLLALVFGRLSRIAPQAGGPYAYTRRGFGDLAAFLVAWGYWISVWVGNAAIAVAFTSYLGFLWPPLAETPAAAASVALAAIWILTGVNALGVREAGLVQLATTVLKLVPLIAIGIVGLFFLDTSNFVPFNASGSSSLAAITATATLTLWALTGLESATIPADHVRDPERTIPRATVTGTLFTATIYIFATVAVMGLIPPRVLARSGAPFAEAASAMWGGWAAYAVAVGAAISCFGALNGWILMQGQVPLAAARDGLFPRIFGRLSKKKTPAIGMVVSSGLATALLLMNFTRGLVGLFTFAILLATLTVLVPYVMSAMAELMIFIRERERFAGERLLGSAVIALLAFIYSMWAIAGAGRDAVYWGALLLAAGLPVYVWITWRGGGEEGGGGAGGRG